MKQNLNDFQYKWYLYFEDEYEKSIFGLSFDPYFELEKYETETIPDYVNLYRKNSIFNTDFLSRFIDVIIACENKVRLINLRIQNYTNCLFILTDENLNQSFNKLKVDNESNECVGCLITIIVLCFLLPVWIRGYYSSIFSNFSDFLAFCFGGFWFGGLVFRFVQLIMNFMIVILFFFFKLFLIFRFHKLLYYFYSFLNKNLHSILILTSLFVID
jgi:hypothetical protein